MTSTTTLETIVKSTSLVHLFPHNPTPPVIVVGLPRSGSSYLAHVLSCLEDWFIFDDLYAYQKADMVGIANDFDLVGDRQRLQAFVNKLSWQLWAKIKYEENFQVPNLNLDDPFEMEAALLSALEAYHSDSEKPITWPQVLEEWMMRLALHGGKHHWGYKTPQDFMHMDKLTQIFPGVRFVYILRDPRKMMRSFKNLPRVKTDGNQDGESRQYHPAVYALYWKKAYEKVQAFIRQGKAPVKTVKFEDLVQDPAAVAADLADFLETQVAGEVVAKRSNASVKVGQPTELTQTEVFLCEKIAGQAMQSAGYELCAPKPRLFDLVDLLKTSVTFATYQLIRITKDKKARTSVRAFLKSLVK